MCQYTGATIAHVFTYINPSDIVISMPTPNTKSPTAKSDNGRKFVIRELPGDAYLTGCAPRILHQGYLRIDLENEMKVVEKVLGFAADSRVEHWVVLKTSSLAGREAEKKALDKAMFDFLFRGTVGQQTHKIRYEITEGDYVLYFDKFVQPTKKGELFMFEVDVVDGSTAKLEDYVFPAEAWAEGRIEVSNNPSYLNQNLAN